MALRIAAQLMIPTKYQHWAADMDDDGQVRANDATLILRVTAVETRKYPMVFLVFFAMILSKLREKVLHGLILQ